MEDSPLPDMASPMSLADAASPAPAPNHINMTMPGGQHPSLLMSMGQEGQEGHSDSVLSVEVPGSNPMECEGQDDDFLDQGASLGARPKTGSNVIVDDSPLQNQMAKNKECKTLVFISFSFLLSRERGVKPYVEVC